MSRPGALLLALIVMAGCGGSSEPMTVVLTHAQGPGDEVAFTATGQAVDEGSLCAAGSQMPLRMESMSGAALTEDDWAQMFDTALESGGSPK